MSLQLNKSLSADYLYKTLSLMFSEYILDGMREMYHDENYQNQNLSNDVSDNNYRVRYLNCPTVEF